MRLLEDMLLNEEKQAIDRVLSAGQVAFSELIKLANLDVTTDLKYADLRNTDMSGSDLRGYNFEGADLRNCAKDEYTILDETTTLRRAKIGWISKEVLSALPLMITFGKATSDLERERILSQLIEVHGLTDHVVEFMVKSAVLAKSLDQFLLICGFVPAGHRRVRVAELRLSADTLLRKRVKAAEARTGRRSSVNLALEAIFGVMQKAKPATLTEFVLRELANLADRKETAVSQYGSFHIEESDLKAALQKIG